MNICKYVIVGSLWLYLLTPALAWSKLPKHFDRDAKKEAALNKLRKPPKHFDREVIFHRQVVAEDITADNVSVDDNLSVHGDLYLDGTLFAGGVQPVLNAANVGTGAGQIFRNKIADTLYFKTLAAAALGHILITNDPNDVSLTTDATSADIPGTIVSRDGFGNFSAGTITANLVGSVTGTITGTATSAINFLGPLSGDVTGFQSTTSVASVGGQSSANVGAATSTVLAATSSDVVNTLVQRDGFGNFSAGTITLSSTGSLNFGNSNTAISDGSGNLNFVAGGIDQMIITGTTITASAPLLLKNLLLNQATQIVVPVNTGSVSVAQNTGILVLEHTGAIASYTVNFPPNPTNGQYFTILCASTYSITISSVASSPATAVVNPILTLAPGSSLDGTTGGCSVTYYYFAPTTSWYCINRG